MLLYKLTTQDHKTRKGEANECLWGENISHSGTGKGGLCSPAYIHAYTDPLLAVLLNPIHASLKDPVLWECEGEIAQNDWGLKVGCVSLTTLRQIPLPVITSEQRTKFAIACALEVYDNAAFSAWAKAWVSGDDRTQVSAAAYASAAYAAYAAARAADASAAYAAARAAYASAAYAADAAADAAYAADAAADAAAARAAYASAAYAAAYAADAADAAAAKVKPLDLIAIAHKACL